MFRRGGPDVVGDLSAGFLGLPFLFVLILNCISSMRIESALHNPSSKVSSTPINSRDSFCGLDLALTSPRRHGHPWFCFIIRFLRTFVCASRGALHHGSRTFLGVRAVRSPFLRDDLRSRPSVGSRDLRVGARLTVASL